jgi:RNA polymerase sigma factor (sigma-70 family)
VRAFNELVQTYGRRVSGLVLRMLGNKAEAEDLTQEVFVQVFKAIGSFRGDSKLSTWIYRIAVNLCKNRSKYLRVRHASEQDELEAVAERENLGEARRANVAQIERPDEAMAHVPRVPHPLRRRGAQLRGDPADHRASGWYSEEQDLPRARAAQGDRRAGARREDRMTEEEKKGPAEAATADEEEAVPEVAASPALKALLKRSLAPADAPAEDAPKEEEQDKKLLVGVQRRLRQRSKGKFYGDGWSTSQSRLNYVLIAAVMLLTIVVVYLAHRRRCRRQRHAGVRPRFSPVIVEARALRCSRARCPHVPSPSHAPSGARRRVRHGSRHGLFVHPRGGRVLLSSSGVV